MAERWNATEPKGRRVAPPPRESAGKQRAPVDERDEPGVERTVLAARRQRDGAAQRNAGERVVRGRAPVGVREAEHDRPRDGEARRGARTAFQRMPEQEAGD